VEKRSTRGGRRACLSLQAPSLSRRTSPRSKAAMRSSVVALAGSGAGGSRSTREQLRCDGEAVYMRAVRCHWWPHPPPLLLNSSGKNLGVWCQRRHAWSGMAEVECGWQSGWPGGPAAPPCPPPLSSPVMAKSMASTMNPRLQ
jgi:hypothetical protein